MSDQKKTRRATRVTRGGLTTNKKQSKGRHLDRKKMARAGLEHAAKNRGARTHKKVKTSKTSELRGSSGDLTFTELPLHRGVEKRKLEQGLRQSMDHEFSGQRRSFLGDSAMRRRKGLNIRKELERHQEFDEQETRARRKSTLKKKKSGKKK